MKIYLAGGGCHGWGYLVFKNYHESKTKVYLAGENYKEQAMKIYFAGEHTVKNGKEISNQIDKLYILESYIYCKDNKHFPLVVEKSKDLLLDSGAYTFMRGNATSSNFTKYTEQLAEFINHWDINYFFELDIDSVVGLKEVERLRKLLESKTSKPSIPVWHKSRGLDYWTGLTKDYKYISLSASGNNNSSEWTRTPQGIKVMRKLNDIALSNGCKVHALGYTKIPVLKYIKFHSVDSTAWIYGNRGGFLYHFNGSDLIKQPKPPKTRLKSKNTAIHNFNEWVKFQKWAEKNI